MSPARAVVLDCDGTLLDTAPRWAAAERAVAAAHGATWTDADREVVHGLALPAAAAALAAHLPDRPEPAAILVELLGRYEDAVRADGVDAMPGADTLLEALRRDSFRLAVASNTPAAQLALVRAPPPRAASRCPRSPSAPRPA